jgi:flagellar biosynthetic protein FlhB
VGATKSEEPTPRRLRTAREEGDTGASVFASQAIALVAVTALVPATVSAVAFLVEERLHDAIHRAAERAVTTRFDVARTAEDVVLLSLPILVAAALASGLASLVQTGGVLGARRLAPRLERLNPLRGLGRLVSRAHVFAAIRAMIGGALVAWIVFHDLRVHAGDIVRASGRLGFVRGAATAIAGTVAWRAALLGIALATLDVVVTRADWTRRLRMSRDEVRRELKEAGGDPVAKGARERARTEAAAPGATADVKGATVVVCEGRRTACALRYAERDVAPRVVASGSGSIAEGIVREARSHGIPVVDDVDLARALADCSAGEAIPETIYDAVAGVLSDLPR